MLVIRSQKLDRQVELSLFPLTWWSTPCLPFCLSCQCCRPHEIKTAWGMESIGENCSQKQTVRGDVYRVYNLQEPCGEHSICAYTIAALISIIRSTFTFMWTLPMWIQILNLPPWARIEIGFRGCARKQHQLPCRILTTIELLCMLRTKI